jgi:16S rRNA (guanine966-N2)-methyltransferase
MLRITGGERRGARLWAPPGDRTRPALARLRVCVFDVLGARVEGARVVDLFAGSGAMGLEALSRGAAGCLFFERSIPAADAIRRNLAHLRFEDRGRLVRADVYRCDVPPADLAFVDPPYDHYRLQPQRVARLLKRASAALWVIEHTPEDRFVEGLDFLKAVDRRAFGQTVVTFAESR